MGERNDNKAKWKRVILVMAVGAILWLPLSLLLSRAVTGQPRTLADWAFGSGCSPRTYSALIWLGMDPNAELSMLDEPLLTAAASVGCTEVIAVLLDAEADPNAATDRGRSPLDAAAYRGDVEIAKLLIDAGATMQARAGRNVTPLATASMQPNVEMMRFLIAAGAKPDAPHDGSAALTYAADSGSLEAVRLLLEHGARVDARCFVRSAASGWSDGHREVIRSLLKHGADVDCRSATAPGDPTDTGCSAGDDETALMTAARAGIPKTVTLLLESGADATLTDREGRTALDHAKEGVEHHHHDRWRDVVKLLESATKASPPINPKLGGHGERDHGAEGGNAPGDE